MKLLYQIHIIALYFKVQHCMVSVQICNYDFVCSNAYRVGSLFVCLFICFFNCSFFLSFFLYLLVYLLLRFFSLNEEVWYWWCLFSYICFNIQVSARIIRTRLVITGDNVIVYGHITWKTFVYIGYIVRYNKCIMSTLFN